MDDRELLERAARAVGYKWDDYGIDGIGNWWAGDDYLENWNPLTDDGDALRLAVKLALLFKPEFAHFLGLERFAGQDHDDCRANRRAIVRAAAELACEKAK